MTEFDFTINGDSAVKRYDNRGAYAQLQTMMEREEVLSVRFYVDSTTKAIRAWIESRDIKGFSYELKQESYKGLMDYLLDGKISDFDNNPDEADTWEKESDFALQVMLMLIDMGKHLQYVPLFRESPNYITAFFNCMKGKIMFRVKREEGTLVQLREKGQNI